MNFLSAFALVMLVLVGYSSGMTLAGRHKAPAPAVLDLLLIVGLWLLAFAFRDALGHWLSLLIWFLVALGVGALLTALRYRDRATTRSPAALPSGLSPLRAGWERWKRFALEMGNVQSRLLAGFFYFTVVVPFGLIARLTGDPLQLRAPAGVSVWQPKEAPDRNVEAARRQG